MKNKRRKKIKVEYYSDPTPTQVAEFWATGVFTYPVKLVSKKSGKIYLKSGTNLIMRVPK